MTLSTGGSDSTELMREVSGCMNTDGHGQVLFLPESSSIPEAVLQKVSNDLTQMAWPRVYIILLTGFAINSA